MEGTNNGKENRGNIIAYIVDGILIGMLILATINGFVVHREVVTIENCGGDTIGAYGRYESGGSFEVNYTINDSGKKCVNFRDGYNTTVCN